MKQNIGRTRIKLAEILQNNFPSRSGVLVTWRPEWLYPATGAYRTNQSLDCFRWEGFAKHIDESGKEIFTAFSVGSYFTMSEIIKYSDLAMDGDGEITPVVVPNE